MIVDEASLLPLIMDSVCLHSRPAAEQPLLRVQLSPSATA
eukprot:CAMPEP_0196751882 /NCGR_PEP_ID=MMETSP1091-20130531/85329_1 /TAXON_ID=302021 /ORGANISM="Rhodomonas sp., Strain CCMP768" /LENGTH=39 /DNA_ID= /DNA_START= /DNA_END= /DNA_ORIENTATION=